MEIKKAGKNADLLLFHGGAEGDRTPDPKTASLVLSQLSYSPTLFRSKVLNLTSAPVLVKRKEAVLGPRNARGSRLTTGLQSATLFRMKRTATILVLFFAFVGAAPAHPGMTDRYDGHKCFKKCEDWGIFYGEYHLHDKDRKPVRVMKQPKLHRSDESVFVPERDEGGANAPVAIPVAAEPKVVVVREQSILPVNPYLLLLLALLILLLVLLMERRGKERTGNR